MWSIRILTGPLKGQSYSITKSSTVIGRSEVCDITIDLPSVSKKHLKIEVHGHGIQLTDLNSSNGTFVNGKQISNHIFQSGDKLSLHDVILDIVPTQSQVTNIPLGANSQMQNQFEPQAHQTFAYDGNAVLDQQPQMSQQPYTQAENDNNAESEVRNPEGIEGIKQLILNYIQNIVLPGVYMIPKSFEFKWVLGLFIAAFIFFVTSLSSIPLLTILKSSIEKESQQRALTIAKTLAMINQGYIHQGIGSAVSVNFALKEPGVDSAFIISAIDGSIMAPSNQSGEYPDIPFIHEARKTGLPSTKQIDSSTIVSLVPIKVYDPNTGSQTVKAYSVIQYNMGSLAVDNGKTLSLLIQVFFIALVIGLLLYFFLYKIIEHPLDSINKQLDDSLKNEGDQIQTDYKFDVLQNLVSNINSAISRGSQSPMQDFGSEQNQVISRDMEIFHLTQLIGFPAMSIGAENGLILSVNLALEEKIGMSQTDLQNAPLDKLIDQALQLNLKDLVDKAQMISAPTEPIINSLEINGENFEINLLPIFGDQNVSYYIIVFLNYGDA